MKRKFLILFSCVFILISCEKQDESINPEIESKVPLLSTQPISDLTLYSVILGGTVIDTVGSKLIEQGIVVGLDALPTIDKNFAKFSLEVDSLGNFSTTVIDIPPNTKYYLRAYGVNKEGVGYGNEIIFKSLNEKIFSDNVTIYTQEELNEFGKNNYTTIEGSLDIWGPVEDLTPLNSLVIIGNGFEVKNTLLTDFKGLENLEIVGRDFYHHFWIENNQSLKNFYGLKKLKITKGWFIVCNNNSLVDLKGLDSYTTSNGNFSIGTCEKLISLDGLEKMLFISGVVLLANNPKLTDLSAWKNLVGFSDEVFINNNESLASVNCFNKIQQLEGIELKDNKVLTDLGGFNNINSLKFITINNNDLLHDLSPFNNIESLDYLNIESSNSITDLQGFCNLKSIKEVLTIFNNPKLVDLTGLEKLNNLGYLSINKNDFLSSLKGLNNIRKLTALNVWTNKNLKSLFGLNNLNQVYESIGIYDNELLDDFCALKLLFSRSFSGSSLNISNNAVNLSPAEIVDNCP